MKKISIRKSWSEILYTAEDRGTDLLCGLIGLLWSLFDVIANLFIRAYEYSVKAIRAYPCVAFVAAVIIAVAVNILSYADVKTKLNTAVYQRDSIEMKLQRYEQFKK